MIKILTFCKVALGQIIIAESSEMQTPRKHGGAHARAFGKDVCPPAVRCVGNSMMFLMCLSFPYPRVVYAARGAVAGTGEGQEKVVWLHRVRKKYSVHVAAVCAWFAGLRMSFRKEGLCVS